MIEEQVKDRLLSIKGVVPDPYNLPPGCRFHPRCESFVPGVCDREEPVPVQVTPGHFASCLLLGGRNGQ